MDISTKIQTLKEYKGKNEKRIAREQFLSKQNPGEINAYRQGFINALIVQNWSMKQEIRCLEGKQEYPF